MKFDYLTRRELMEILRALSAIPLVTACEKVTGDSDTKDLTNSTSLTEISQQRVQHVIQKFGMESWNKYQGGGRQDVFDNLATVPDVYLKFLQERAQSVGFAIYAGGQAAGMCWFDNVGATKITLNSPSFATIHEVGHGVETFAHKLQNISDGSSLRERTYSQVTGSAEASLIRSYAKSNSKELFADGFSSFYRSPKARADLAKMPITWKWLKSVLVRPVNLGPSENPADFIDSPSDLATPGSGPATPPPATAMAVDNTTLDENIVMPETSSAGTVESGPAASPASATPVAAGADPCANATDPVIAMICQLSKQIGTSGSGFTLTDSGPEDEILLPNKNQFLTAHDKFLLMARLSLTAKEASRVKVYLDKKVIATGLEKDPYAGRSEIFSTMFVVPTDMTPSKELDYASKTISLVLDGKVLQQTPVRVSRYSLCGDISDLGIRR